MRKTNTANIPRKEWQQARHIAKARGFAIELTDDGKTVLWRDIKSRRIVARQPLKNVPCLGDYADTLKSE